MTCHSDRASSTARLRLPPCDTAISSLSLRVVRRTHLPLAKYCTAQTNRICHSLPDPHPKKGRKSGTPSLYGHHAPIALRRSRDESHQSHLTVAARMPTGPRTRTIPCGACVVPVPDSTFASALAIAESRLGVRLSSGWQRARHMRG